MADGTADGTVENLASEIGGLNINCSGPQQSRPLTTAIDELDQTVDSLKQQLASFKTLLVNNSLTNGDVTATCQVSEQVNRIRNVTQGLNNAVVQSIVTHITSLEKQKAPDTSRLLEYFDTSIKAIVMTLLLQRNGGDTLWKIVEECCMQAVPLGQLDPDDYLVSIPHPEPLSHLNEDVEARQRVADGKKRNVRDDWTRFWAQCLNKCPGGPTLFIPPKYLSPSEKPPPTAEDLSRYLFMPYERCNGTQLDKEELSFLRLRFNGPHYENGGYLFRVTVNLRGRSCTTSLPSSQMGWLGLAPPGVRHRDRTG